MYVSHNYEHRCYRPVSMIWGSSVSNIFQNEESGCELTPSTISVTGLLLHAHTVLF